MLIMDQAQALNSWIPSLNAGVAQNPEGFKAREVDFANSSCALSNKLNFTVPAYLQSISNLC